MTVATAAGVPSGDVPSGDVPSSPVAADPAGSPHPLGATLPALFQEDELAQRFCAALDQVLGPAITLLDCFPAYLQPLTTPPDVLAWLAGWLGLPVIDHLPEQRRRRLVARACALHAARGTAQGIRDLVALVTGSPVELLESGGTVVSTTPGSALPGPAETRLLIRVRGAQPVTDQLPLLTQLLLTVLPAHLPWTVEFA